MCYVSSEETRTRAFSRKSPSFPLFKGGVYEEKIIHPHPGPLPSRERAIKVKGAYR
jgi:hypothetical protein